MKHPFKEEEAVREAPSHSGAVVSMILGLTASMSEPQKRLIVFVFAFCLMTAASFPLFVAHPQGLLGPIVDQYWYAALAASAAAALIVLRVSKAGQMVGTFYCLWLIVLTGYYPIIAADAQYLPLLMLICMPVVMGMISGVTSSVLGTVSVLAVYVGVGLSARSSAIGATDHDLMLLAYAGICAIVSCFAFVYFGNSTMIQSRALTDRYRQIEEEALSDPLTGCANRRALQKTMDRLYRGAEVDKCYAAIVIDLDRFKQINDTFGHEAGDRVLSVFSDRLKMIAGHRFPVYRMGGDEFAIILENVESAEALQTVGDQIVSAAKVPISFGGNTLEFAASIGIAFSDGEVGSLKLLYEKADAAAFVAKKSPGASFVIFDATLDGATTRKFEIEQCLKSAIRQNSINVAIQPQVDLKNGSVLGYEVLARWNDPLLGKICPSEFIPIAEQTRLIEILDRQIMARAIRGASFWLPRHQYISINVSARTLNSNEFVKHLTALVKRTRLDPSQIELEITETALIENWETSKKTVRELRAKGFRIALDDFGVGYSSLSYLIEFPIHKIKFDRLFIQKSAAGVTPVVLQSLIDLAKKMDVEIVAEGIETKEQLNLLKELGCPSGQGFLLGRPQLREDIKMAPARAKSAA